MSEAFANGSYQVSWLRSLDRYGQEVMSNKFREGSIDYLLTLEQALKMTITIKNKSHTLAWVAKHRPARLELEMDLMNPGSVLFQAVTLVYNANLDRVLRVVKVENQRMRQAGIDGLRRMKSRPPLRSRPVKSEVRSVLRVRPTKGHRLFLKQ